MVGNNVRFLRKRLRYWLAAIILLSATGTLAQEFRPDDLELGPVCDNAVLISWKAAPGATSYHIVDPHDEYRILCRSSDNSCEVDGLKTGQKYTFLVDALIDGNLVYGTESIGLRVKDSDLCPDNAPRKTPTPRPSVDTCSYLPADIVVRSNSRYNVQCSRVGSAGVGNADLIAQGVLDAVDIWHIVENSIQVCFRNHGALKFLDAATSPRAVSDLAAARIDGMTCGTIDRAGTVVMLQTSEPVSEPVTEPVSEPVTEPVSQPVSDAIHSPPAASAAQAESAILSNCQLTTFSNLSLRSGSSIFHARLAIIPRETRLEATFRNGDWYRVFYEELTGWVNGAYVKPGPGCGAGVANVVPGDVADSGQVESPGTSLSNCTLRASDIINLRAGPGLGYGILAEIPYRAEMRATERLEAWYKVDYQGQTGWVNIGYVTRISGCG